MDLCPVNLYNPLLKPSQLLALTINWWNSIQKIFQRKEFSRSRQHTILLCAHSTVCTERESRHKSATLHLSAMCHEWKKCEPAHSLHMLAHRGQTGDCTITLCTLTKWADELWAQCNNELDKTTDRPLSRLQLDDSKIYIYHLPNQRISHIIKQVYSLLNKSASQNLSGFVWLFSEKLYPTLFLIRNQY